MSIASQNTVINNLRESIQTIQNNLSINTLTLNTFQSTINSLQPNLQSYIDTKINQVGISELKETANGNQKSLIKRIDSMNMYIDNTNKINKENQKLLLKKIDEVNKENQKLLLKKINDTNIYSDKSNKENKKLLMKILNQATKS